MFAVSSQQALLATLFLDLAIIAGFALALGTLARRVGQAVVVGEITAGLLLGPSVLGLLPGDLDALLFPPTVLPYLEALASVALVLFMFGIGFEIDIQRLRRSGADAMRVASAAVLAPVIAAVVIAPALWSVHGLGRDGVLLVQFTAFVAIVFSVTALPVLARVLSDAKLSDSPLGTLALTVAAMTDLVAWVSLAALTATFGRTDGLPFGAMALGLVGFLVLLVFAVRPLLRWGLARSWCQRYGPAGASLLLLVALALCAAATTQLGLHPAFGAFALGVACPRDVLARRSGSDPRASVEGALGGAEPGVRRLLAAGLLLIPVYFMVTGLRVDLTNLGLGGVLEIFGLLLVVTTSKVSGAAWAAARSGFDRGRSLALGLLLNTRGLTELVVLDIGRRAGVIDAQLFTVLVVVALLTTAMTMPLLPLAMRIGRRRSAREAIRASTT
jgi:Kef-type K+ transport system membrane component KefB